MTLQEIRDKHDKLVSEGKSEKEISELLKDDISAFAEECFDKPEKMDVFAKQIEEEMKSNSIMNTFLFGFLTNNLNGWGSNQS